eukprot:425908_1
MSDKGCEYFANSLTKYLKNSNLKKPILDLCKAITNQANTPEAIQYEKEDNKNIQENPYLYDFGIKLTYWDESDPCYVKDKYKNLKQEIMQNNIFVLPVDQWKELDYNCLFFYGTDSAKKYLP